MSKTKIKALRYSLYAVVSVVFLGIFSTSTSPLTDACGYDSAFFTLVGRGMTDGLLPYRDFFDMKGPYLFFFEYLGQLLFRGRAGAFILQWINLTACLWVLDSIYTSKLRLFSLEGVKGFLKLFFAGVAPVLAFAAYTFERGNLTEEFSLLFLLIALKFMLNYFDCAQADSKSPHPLKYGFCYGIFFGILALIRITNAALIGAIILTVALELLCSKQLKNLLLNGLMFTLGTGVAFAPMVLFFFAKGLLGEMLYQVFIFGFNYSSEFTFMQKVIFAFSQHWDTFAAMVVPVFLTLILAPKKRKYCVFAVSSYVLLCMAVCMGNGYPHYFTLGLPNIAFAIAVIFREEKTSFVPKSKKWITCALCAATLLLHTPNLIITSGACVSRILNLENNQSYADTIEIKSYIPEEDYNSVYVYINSLSSAWYLTADLYPPIRYCDWQSHYMTLSPQINEELLEFFAKATPKWVVTWANYPVDNKDIREVLNTEYIVYAKNANFRLYQRKQV